MCEEYGRWAKDKTNGRLADHVGSHWLISGCCLFRLTWVAAFKFIWIPVLKLSHVAAVVRNGTFIWNRVAGTNFAHTSRWSPDQTCGGESFPFKAVHLSVCLTWVLMEGLLCLWRGAGDWAKAEMDGKRELCQWLKYHLPSLPRSPEKALTPPTPLPIYIYCPLLLFPLSSFALCAATFMQTHMPE